MYNNDQKHIPNDHPSPLIVRQLSLASKTVQVSMRQMTGLPVHNGDRVWQNTCVCLIIAGEGRYRCDGDWTPVGPGTVFLHPRGRSHRIERQRPHKWCEWSLTLHPTLEDFIFPLGFQPPDVAAFTRQNFQVIQSAYKRLLTSLSKTELADQYVLLAIQEFLATLISDRDHDSSLTQAANNLASDIRAELSIDEVAQDIGLSPVHFRRVFKEQFGCSPSAYRDQSRMQRAEILLSDEALTVTDAAKILGYATPFALSRRFKEQFGMSPKLWRQQLLGKEKRENNR